MNTHLDVECREGDILAGKYELVSPIAEGAMGVVWAAVNTVLGMNVAIKIVHRRVTSPAAARRLLSEAQAGSKLNHRATVRVFDHGETAQGDPFVVMERLSGETLREKMDREGHLEPSLAVRLLLPIAGGLHAAHEHGIVHRDVKPENIVMAVEDGTIQPKVVDFGVARLAWMDRDDTTIVGTLGYMPLEQVCGESIDQRVDVWAFSAVLYEAIAGRLPFGADCLGETLFELTQGEATSLLGVTGVDLPLAKIVAKGLRRSPAERWSDLHELGVALARWLSYRGIVDDVSGTSLAMYWLREGGSHHDATSNGATERHSDSGAPRADGSLTPIPLSRGSGVAKEAGPRRRQARLVWIGLAALILSLSAAFTARGVPSFVGGSRRAAAGNPRGEEIPPAPGPRPMEAIVRAPAAMASPPTRPPPAKPVRSADVPPQAEVQPADSARMAPPVYSAVGTKRAKPTRPVDVYEEVVPGDGGDPTPGYDPL